MHRTVWVLVPVDPQLFQPLNHRGGISNQGLDQLGDIGKAAAAHGVQVVDGRGIVGPVRRLSPGLSTHGIGVTEAQFGYQQGLSPIFLSQECRRGSGATAADYQDINIMVNLTKVNLVRVNSAVPLQQGSHLIRSRLPPVRPHHEPTHSFFNKVNTRI